MNVFEKVANNSKRVKEAMNKEAFIGAIAKKVFTTAVKKPLQTIGLISDAKDVQERTNQSNQSVREAKARANMRNLNTRV